MAATDYSTAADANVTNALTSFVGDARDTTDAVARLQDAVDAQRAGARARGASASTQLDAQAIEHRIQQYAMMNENQNANAYILQLAGREKTRLSRARREVERDQHKLKMAALRADYLLGYYRASKTFVVLTLFATVLLFVLAALWRTKFLTPRVFVAVALVLMLAYLMAAVSMAGRLAIRRPDAGWNEFDWAVSKSMKDGLDASARCPAPSLQAGAAGAGAASTITCADASAQYVAANSVLSGMLPVVDHAGQAVPPALQAWWHFYVTGQRAGWTWPYGTACRDATAPDVAARMYMEKYLPAGQTSFGPNTTPYQDYLANQAVRGDWPGQVPTASGAA
jgi:hypothetical protein